MPRPRRTRRRRGVTGPIWSPTPVDATLAQIQPLPGWVVVEEARNMQREAVVAGTALQVIRPWDRHTVYGRVLAIGAETVLECGVGVGDQVIYREWAGGRWSLAGGLEILLMQGSDILATYQ